jgi:copper chaperone
MSSGLVDHPLDTADLALDAPRDKGRTPRGYPEACRPRESCHVEDDRAADLLSSRCGCEHCRDAITSEVRQVAGVSQVDVDLAGKTVTVAGSDLDGAAIRAAIEDAGYDIA